MTENEAIKELYEDGTVDTIAKKYGLQEMLIKQLFLWYDRETIQAS